MLNFKDRRTAESHKSIVSRVNGEKD
ncbi:hypothetical protein PITCH_A330053 [uncultured Desulfobacterium sp.]|uniref:Uncharacterized protein n=1 Tax=uncultured Desulfobacterium sp. TaxID=201089 RepID=A0A445MZ72_9BACT|nr:hypothetical protein PITCH_A330053 [uncultured Desulfobacterium sp.]